MNFLFSIVGVCRPWICGYRFLCPRMVGLVLHNLVLVHPYTLLALHQKQPINASSSLDPIAVSSSSFGRG